jgi:citrate synthase
LIRFAERIISLFTSQGANEMTNGLEDVVAAETILSDVRGAEGQLIIRG